MNITEKLTERIKEQFVNLLTEEELEEIVKKEIDSFFDENTRCFFKIEKKHDYYKGHYTEISSSENMSPIRSIVYQVMVNMVADKLKGETIQNYFSGLMIEENGAIKNKTEDLIKEAIPLAINSYFENIARNMTTQLQIAMTNNNGSNY